MKGYIQKNGYFSCIIGKFTPGDDSRKLHPWGLLQNSVQLKLLELVLSPAVITDYILLGELRESCRFSSMRLVTSVYFLSLVNFLYFLSLLSFIYFLGSSEPPGGSGSVWN